MNLDEKKLEDQHLKLVVNKVVNAKEQLNKMMSALGLSTLERLQELRENPEMGLDFLLLLEQLHDKNESFNLKDKYKRLEELAYLIKNPYFARIDLSDLGANAPHKFYIGKFGYTEEMPVVTDWRTKVASVYYRYRYPQKDVSYDTPDGIAHKDLTLKRTYEIDEGYLVKYFNNDLQLDENEIISEKIKKRTGGVLEDIIETIQQSQMDIIEADPRQVCIVQGCVGSGKSTVAIHKLSHIFFNFPNYIRPEKSILIAKNQILVGYLSTLFPKLGIFDINFKTLRDLIVNAIFREEVKIIYDMDQNEDTSVYDMAWYANVTTKLNGIHKDTEDRINDLFSDSEFESYSGYKYSRDYTPTENIIELITELSEELQMQTESYKENTKSIKGMLHKENVETIKKIIKRLQKIKSDVKDVMFPHLVYELNVNTKEKLGYAEVILYMYLYAKIVGFKNSEIYEYCIVDEGQDFGILEYLFLDQLVLRGRFGIFGDLNQALEDDSITNWSDIIKVIRGAQTANVFKLTTNYRSTEPIIRLATNILTPYTNDYLPNSINRIGNEPEVAIFDDAKDLLAKFYNSLKEDVRDLSKSIGVICFDHNLKAEINALTDSLNISSERLIKLDKARKIFYIPTGVYLMDFDDCKGLEFAKVYVLGLNLDTIKKYSEAKKAYVAVTRAMNELHVFGIK